MWMDKVPGTADIIMLSREVGISGGNGYIDTVDVPIVGRITIFGVKDRRKDAGIAILPAFEDDEFEVYFWKED